MSLKSKDFIIFRFHPAMVHLFSLISNWDPVTLGKTLRHVGWNPTLQTLWWGPGHWKRLSELVAELSELPSLPGYSPVTLVRIVSSFKT